MLNLLLFFILHSRHNEYHHENQRRQNSRMGHDAIPPLPIQIDEPGKNDYEWG